jgi:hypothetical protein
MCLAEYRKDGTFLCKKLAKALLRQRFLTVTDKKLVANVLAVTNQPIELQRGVIDAPFTVHLKTFELSSWDHERIHIREEPRQFQLDQEGVPDTRRTVGREKGHRSRSSRRKPQ